MRLSLNLFVILSLTLSSACGQQELYTSAKSGNRASLQKLTALATADDPGAQYNLALMYATGEGVPKDSATAVSWYRKAAEQGYPGAQYNLALMYAKGEGVPRDFATAVSWARKAAEQGHDVAQYELGRMYDTGEVVPKDLVMAYMWANLAAVENPQRVNSTTFIDPSLNQFRQNLDKIEAQMTPAQIAEAQKLSREWKPHCGVSAGGSAMVIIPGPACK